MRVNLHTGFLLAIVTLLASCQREDTDPATTSARQ